MKHAIAVIFFLAAWPAFADVIEGRVIEVSDGATLTILAKEGSSIHRVRLAGIEAPARARTYGGKSRESLRRLAIGRTVRVETTVINAKGLLVGTVLLMRNPKDCVRQPCEQFLDPGLRQLSFGWAIIDKANLARQSEEAQKRYLSAEAHARASRLGVWREPNFQVRTEVVQTR